MISTQFKIFSKADIYVYENIINHIFAHIVIQRNNEQTDDEKVLYVYIRAYSNNNNNNNRQSVGICV